MMASHEHHHHLLGFSSSSSLVTPSPAAMAMAFDHHGLLALHDDMPPRPGGAHDRSWPLQVSTLSLYGPAGGGPSYSLAGGEHELQPFTMAPPWMMSMQQQQQPFRLNSSRYLGPAKELLREFCSLEGDAMNGGVMMMQAPKRDDDVEASSPACGPWGANPSVSSMDYMALERRKARLLSMVEEVDRCYRRYCEKMRAAELSFEAVAGTRAAQVYTKLAMRAMSRHFRCLRDALVGQIRTLKKSMGESRDADGMLVAPGASKGDTPRLRVVDQCLRRQRAFQQYGGAAVIESCPWRPQRGLPERAVAVLRSWLFEHFLHPYPNDVDKHILARQSGLSRSQVSNWFINARVRLWKPMIEEMYAEETVQHDDDNASGGRCEPAPTDHHNNNLAAWTTVAKTADQSCHRRSGRNNPGDCFIPSSFVADSGQFLHGYPSLYGDGGSGAVSLTLGLQQQRAFASLAMITQQQSPLMIGAEEEDMVLPYRNLMGSELLHDFLG
ncbi:homeobox protein BEL1 homolog [Triticum dicoccoides]|uniref:homeobox protein BEL1 homolog n=1 Tax=Triticum dicoccoides TaxID=85692 RepID=UPI000E7A3872|nr:homeobox protein BEL1 homolog [Triticum dicoccoides]